MYKYAIKSQLINFLINSLVCPGLPQCCHDDWFSRVVLSLLSSPFLCGGLLIIFLSDHTFHFIFLPLPMLSPFTKKKKIIEAEKEGATEGGRQRWWGLRELERCGIAGIDREVNMDLAMARSSNRKQEGELEERGRHIRGRVRGIRGRKRW